ncbi:MAG: efflux RND transporter periplasmic adaptor subunit [Vibrio sp.]|uniref:efflux RND transporter periplasmic adaptor subunit n=1 Tax=Vibrio sp. TaxID=678 RepID=UPI003A86B286
MKNVSILSIALAVALFASEGVVAAGSKGAPAISVVTDLVQVHQVSQSLSLVGKLEAEQSVIISAEVSGKVDNIAVKANQEVKKDQLLVQLSDDKAQASVSEAKAYLRDEKRKLAEYERLLKRSAITQTEIDAQKTSVDIAQARLEAAEANWNDLHIKAPFAGTVGFIDFSRGKIVSSSTELMTLDNLSLMQLDLQVPERYLSMLSKGMNVVATTHAWPDKIFEGKVVGIDSRVNAETLNLRVRIHFSNAERLLKPGMLVSANLAFPVTEAPIIPVQALEYSGTKRYVYVIDQKSKAVRTEVFLGARIDNQVVIEKGLNIGDKVVVQGIVNMRDGANVTEVTVDGRALNKDDN